LQKENDKKLIVEGVDRLQTMTLEAHRASTSRIKAKAEETSDDKISSALLLLFNYLVVVAGDLCIC
jgi:hypothetical protein